MSDVVKMTCDGSAFENKDAFCRREEEEGTHAAQRNTSHKSLFFVFICVLYMFKD